MRQYLLALAVLPACGRLGFDARQVSRDGAQGFTVQAASALPMTAILLTTDAATMPVWSAPDGGSIDARGVFTAPAAEGDYHVEASLDGVVASATVHVTLSLTAAVIDNTGTNPDSTGFAHQHHAAYVDGRWWVWYLNSASSASTLYVSSSDDGVTWTPGPAYVFAKDVGQNPRNLDVAVADLGGHHVVHIAAAFETGRGRYHLRGTLDGGTLVYGTPQVVNQGGSVSPDGPSTVVTPSGLVIDGTGYEATPQTPPLTPCGDGDVEMYTAATRDDGSGAFEGTAWTRTVIWCVPVRVNARRLLADGETLYEIYDDGNQDPDPQNLHYNIRTAAGAWLPDETTYTPPPFVFSTTGTFPLNDWNAVIDGRAIHVIRHTTTNDAFEHRVYDLDAMTGFVDGAGLPPLITSPDQGIVLAHYGTGLIALALTGGNSIAYTFLDTGAWTPWTPLALPAGMRFRLAGGENINGRPLVLWNELGGSYSLRAAVLP